MGSRVNSTEQDIKVRKALAWTALNVMKSVWKSNLSLRIKVSFFEALVESELLYDYESWTLKETLRKSLNGCYIRMLRVVLNVNWSEHVTNKELYVGLPQMSVRIASRRMQFAGYCDRHPHLPAGRLVLWEPLRARWHRSKLTSQQHLWSFWHRMLGVKSSAEQA